MLYVDRRVGSVDLDEPLRQRGCPTEVLTLDFADVAFLGNGPEGANTVSIGIEIKKLHDLLSSIQDGRLSGHQLPGLARQYDWIYLIVEGVWRPGTSDGVLEIPRGGGWQTIAHGRQQFMASYVENYLTTIECQFPKPFYWRRTGSRNETAWQIANLYKRWTSKEWDDHRALRVSHKPHADTASLAPHPLRRRVAEDLDGVGYERAAEVAKHFPNTLEMILAGVEEWRKIKGIGKTLATRIVEAIGRE